MPQNIDTLQIACILSVQLHAMLCDTQMLGKLATSRLMHLDLAAETVVVVILSIATDFYSQEALEHIVKFLIVCISKTMGAFASDSMCWRLLLIYCGSVHAANFIWTSSCHLEHSRSLIGVMLGKQQGKRQPIRGKTRKIRLIRWRRFGMLEVHCLTTATFHDYRMSSRLSNIRASVHQPCIKTCFKRNFFASAVVSVFTRSSRAGQNDTRVIFW